MHVTLNEWWAVNMTVFIYLIFLSYALAINANPLTVAIYPLVPPETLPENPP